MWDMLKYKIMFSRCVSVTRARSRVKNEKRTLSKNKKRSRINSAVSNLIEH